MQTNLFLIYFTQESLRIFQLNLPQHDQNRVVWLIWFINQRALYKHVLSVTVGIGVIVIGIVGVICAHPVWHRVRHRIFIFSIHVHICPPHVHNKYLVILTCSF